MGKVLFFQPQRKISRNQKMVINAKNVVIFPGVRYERANSASEKKRRKNKVLKPH